MNQVAELQHITMPVIVKMNMIKCIKKKLSRRNCSRVK